MAKFTPGAIISEIRGSIADVTYSRSSAGAIAKKKLVQTNPNSPEQIAARALQAAAVAAWQALPQTERDAWIIFADSQLSAPRIDGTHKLGGYNAFIRFYIVLNTYGLAGNPSRLLQEPTGTYSNFQVLITSNVIAVALDGNNANPDIQVVVRASGPLSPGISSISQSSLTIFTFEQSPNGTLAINFTTEWELKWGSLDLSVNKKIFVRIDIVNRVTAQKVVVFRSSAIVPAPPLLVAVADSGGVNRVMTSPDGINWTSQTAADNIQWFAVVYAPSLALFVAVARNTGANSIMTSPDGFVWTQQSAVSAVNWQSLAWSPELGLFQAVHGTSFGGKSMSSPDGINWTSRGSAANLNWQSLTWAPGLGLFVAVASTGGGNRVMTSNDGINWVSQSSSDDNDWQGVVYSPSLNLLVAVANTGAGNRVMTSPDGINWTTRVSAANIDWSSVTWSPILNLFVAVAGTGAGNRVMTSPDGINWTIRLSAADHIWTSVTWSTGLLLFIAVSLSNGGQEVMTSPDGINWTIRNSASNIQWQSVTATS